MKRGKTSTIKLLAIVLALSLVSSAGVASQAVTVFSEKTDGYAAFRIPALLVAADGSVLAFCEGRVGGLSDSGNIDLVMKRSRDGGRTWGELKVIADDGPNTMGNPCPVVDRSTGRIWLPITRNLGVDNEREILDRKGEGSREVWITHSDDHGETWSKPVEITSSVKRPDWTWYATGPGNGIQLRSGRLVIPSDHALAGSKVYGSHVIFSDDHGATWRIGGVISDRVNECQVVELGDGRLMLNMRSYHKRNRRAVATSDDGGLTWSKLRHDEALIEPVCQASLIAVETEQHGQVLLFSNPASTKRERMTIKASLDQGESWSEGVVLHEGPAAYSSLADLGGGVVGCLYERGVKGAYEEIVLERVEIGEISPSLSR